MMKYPYLRLSMVVSLLLTAGPISSANDTQRYLSPHGAGTKDGSTRENAAAASEGGLQKTWDALPPGGTLWLVAGEYPGTSLDIATAPGEGVRTLAGEISGDTRATFTGNFDRKNPARTGGHVVTVMPGASDWAVRNIDFRNVNTAIHLLGGHQRGSIHGVRVFGTREGIRCEGTGKAKAPTRGLKVSDCVFKDFTKRGLRLLSGHEDVQVDRSHADAGGKDWATEPFQMGFTVESGCHNVTFTDCTARGSYDDQGKKYWNGDGFCAESGAGTIRWVRCAAFDNTDGGWDTKADLSVFVDCIALRNKRNIRVWGKATLENCLSAFPNNRGGSGGSACLWARGPMQCTQSTLVGAGLADVEDAGSVSLEKSLIVKLPRVDGKEEDAFPGEGISVTGCEVRGMKVEALKELFPNPDASFEGGSSSFDPKDASLSQGYRKMKSSKP